MKLLSLFCIPIVACASVAFAEVTDTTIVDHLASQPTFDENQIDYNNAMEANIERLSKKVSHDLGVPDIGCWDHDREDLRDCQNGMTRLSRIGYDSRIQQKQFEQIYIGSSFKTAEFAGGKYRVTIDGSASEEEIKAFLLSQRIRSEEELIQMNTLGTMFKQHSNRAKTGLGINKVGCWDYSHSDARACRNGAQKLSRLGFDSRIQRNNFDSIYIGSSFNPAKFVGNNYQVTIDGDASEEEIRAFLQSQERKPRQGLVELNSARSNYRASAEQAEQNLGVQDIGCWKVTLDSARLCELGAAKLAEIGNHPQIRSRGLQYIYIGSSFKPAEYANGRYQVVIDANAPTGEIVNQILQK